MNKQTSTAHVYDPRTCKRLLYADTLIDYLRAKAPKLLEVSQTIRIHWCRCSTVSWISQKGKSIVAFDPGLIEFVKKYPDKHKLFYPMNDFRADFANEGGVAIAFMQANNKYLRLPPQEVKVCVLDIDTRECATDKQCGFPLYNKRVGLSLLPEPVVQLLLDKAAQVAPYSLKRIPKYSPKELEDAGGITNASESI